MSSSSASLFRWVSMTVGTAGAMLPAVSRAQPSPPASATGAVSTAPAAASGPGASAGASAGAPPTSSHELAAFDDLPPADPGTPVKISLEGADESARLAVEDAMWTVRDRDLQESMTLTGGSGLLRTQHAETGAPGQFRLGFVGEWFSAGFLCNAQFPCRDPNTGGALTSDTMSHVGGTLALGVSIAKLGLGTLEAYAATEAYANSDAANRPELLQVLGDTDLGLKYVAPLGDVLRVGADAELLLVNGLGSVGLSGNGTSARFGGIVTADFRGLPSPAPLRISANASYVFDNTGQVVADVETARGAPISRTERYGLGINRVDHVDISIGVEALLATERVRPFLEGRLIAPNNRQGYLCPPNNPARDNCLGNDTVVPAVLTIGGRFFPWRRGFSLLAALDVGLSGTNDFIEEVQPVAPWTLFLGAGWAADTWERPPATKMVHKATAPLTVRIVGFVHERGKNDPVPSALVSYRDRPDLSPLSTAPDGRFGDDVPPGAYTYEIRAEGYKSGTCAAAASLASAPVASTLAAPLPAASTGPAWKAVDVSVDCPLEALPRAGSVVGHVRDADTGQALASVTVLLVDAQRKELRIATDGGGGFRFETVGLGTSQLSILADGYLAIVAPVDVKALQETSVDLLLRPKPKSPEVAVTAKEITIRNQVQFALDSAVILPQSFGLLSEIGDTILRHPELNRIEVQGHTDNSGTAEHNQMLSDERAQSVRAWLTQHGVAPDRLVAKGYGQDKPLAPNVTAANRAQNRRVQFILLDRDAATTNDRPKTTLPGF